MLIQTWSREFGSTRAKLFLSKDTIACKATTMKAGFIISFNLAIAGIYIPGLTPYFKWRLYSCLSRWIPHNRKLKNLKNLNINVSSHLHKHNSVLVTAIFSSTAKYLHTTILTNHSFLCPFLLTLIKWQEKGSFSCHCREAQMSLEENL